MNVQEIYFIDGGGRQKVGLRSGEGGLFSSKGISRFEILGF